MAIGPRLDLRQSQSLVMTPQLQQAIRLLALSNLEIETFIAEELAKNPLLDVGEQQGDGEKSGQQDSDSPSNIDADGQPDITASDDGFMGGQQGDAALDIDPVNDMFDHDCPSDKMSSDSNSPAGDGQLSMNHISVSSGISGQGGEGSSWEDMLSEEPSLYDHLYSQAGEVLSGTDLAIARYLIDLIDSNGYFQADLLDIALQLGAAKADLEQILGVIQTFDPSGVGARSLQECLAIQAKEADRYDPIMERFINNIDLLAKGSLAKLRRICRVDEEDLSDMIKEVRAYNPRPASHFSANTANTVVPDIFIMPKDDGWAVRVNAETMPHLLVNREYYAEMHEGAHDKATKTWLNECLSDASWLVKALDQRQRTIIKVTSEIVKQQEGFFRHGIAHLKPLTLKNVADAIDMHDSTVSRVTSNKYLSCSRGVFELKYFFTSAIQSSDGGDAVSAEAVKSHIKELIDNESPKKILSDDKLVTLLKAEGFDIARRTVAKYREALGLGSSVQRRRQKKLEGKI